MQLSDWLTIIFAIVGIASGAAISWLFFRTQLLTDFGALREKLTKIDVPRDVNAVVNPALADIRSELLKLQHTIKAIDVGSNVGRTVNPKLELMQVDIKELLRQVHFSQALDNGKEIASLRATVEKLDSNLNAAVKEILKDVKAQQFELAERIQKEFRSQSRTATSSVRDAFSKEIGRFVNNTQDKEALLSKLVESFMDGMRVMGEYQRQNIERETSTSIEDIERKVTRSIEDVMGEVVTLREQVIALPSSRTRKG